MAQAQRNLGEILVDEGLLSPEELQEVLEKSRTRNLSLEETLFKLGYISRDMLSSLLARVYGCDFIDLYSCTIDEKALGAIPADECLRLHALPYALDGDTLSVALAGPLAGGSPAEIVDELERLSGKTVRIVLCNPGPLHEMLGRLRKPGAPREEDERVEPARPAPVVGTPAVDDLNASLRAQFDELYDIGQTALIGARSHAFSRSIAAALEEARTKLGEARKLVRSEFIEEAIEMAEQAVSTIKEAVARADSFERDWENLLQQVKRLRSRVSMLGTGGAAEFAPDEFAELTAIHDGLLECVNDRNVEKLRSLLDQGTIIAEKASLLEPDRQRGREQVVTALAQVREVIARARTAGAKLHAPEALQKAYDFLDKAEGAARRGLWDEVSNDLSSAEAHALDAEQIAIEATKEREQLTIKLRMTIRNAVALFDEAVTRPFARDVMEELLQAKDTINEAKNCFESGDLGQGIELAEDIATRIRDEIIPVAEETERAWTDLLRRADSVAANIASIDIPLALAVAPEKMKELSRDERRMIAALCARKRDILAEIVSECERLAEEILQLTAKAQQELREAGAALGRAKELFASVAATGVEQEVAEAFGEAWRSIEEARRLLDHGDSGAALDASRAATAKLEADVIEAQSSTRAQWQGICRRASDVMERMRALDAALGWRIVPEMMGRLSAGEAEIIAALHEENRARLAEAVSVCERLVSETGRRLNDMRDKLKEARAAVAGAVEALAAGAATGIEEQIAPSYATAGRLLEEARELLERGDAAGATDRARAARAELESHVVEPQNSLRGKWVDLVSRSDELIGRINEAASAEALYYCPDLVRTLRDCEADVVSALMARDTEALGGAAAAAGRIMEAIGPAIQNARAERHGELAEELAEVERTIQAAVHRCSGSYAPDMLEDAYLDLNRMKGQIAAGPEALMPESEEGLRRDLAVTRTKVWQVDYMRERFERERAETLTQLRLKIDSAREAVEESVALDFTDKSSALVREARSLLEQVDSLLIDGDIEGSFELVRQCLTAAEQIGVDASEKERQWRELARALLAEDAAHRPALADSEAERIAPEEYRELSQLAEKTQSVIDARDLVALHEHADALGRLGDALAARLEASRAEMRASIGALLREARQEIRLAELLGAKDLCPDVLNAAHTYAGIAERYLSEDDFARARAAVGDALDKSRDTCTLARTAAERAGLLAIDYMKIASSHIEQQQHRAAKDALERGLTLANLARAARRKEPEAAD
jgi:hypothetical protein